MRACASQTNPEMIKLFLEAGADPSTGYNLCKFLTIVDAADPLGITPLYVAAHANSLVIVELLLSFGADPAQGPPSKTTIDLAADNLELKTKLDLLKSGGINRRTPHPVCFVDSTQNNAKIGNFSSWSAKRYNYCKEVYFIAWNRCNWSRQGIAKCYYRHYFYCSRI